MLVASTSSFLHNVFKRLPFYFGLCGKELILFHTTMTVMTDAVIKIFIVEKHCKEKRKLLQQAVTPFLTSSLT